MRRSPRADARRGGSCCGSAHLTRASRPSGSGRCGELRAPALLDWRHELRCCRRRRRDGRGGGRPAARGARGHARRPRAARAVRPRAARRLARAGRWPHRGRAGRAASSSRGSSPPSGDDPYAYVHVRDEQASAAARAQLGLDDSGTRITVPLAAGRPPANARLRRLVGQLVQLRPVLEDPARELWLELPGEPAQLVTLPGPEPDPERPLLFDDEVDVAAGVRARVIVRRAAEPIPLSPSRATRLGGLVIRSGRAAHETTLAGHEGEPGTRHLYGEVICDELEQLQRAALESPRPQVVVKVDRSGLNEHHPFVQRLYRGARARAAADRRRRGAPRRRASRSRRAGGPGPRPGRAAGAQRRAAKRLRRARHRRVRARRRARRRARARRAGAQHESSGRRASPRRPPPPTRRWPARSASSSRRCGCTPARTAASRSSSTRRRYRPARRSR